MKKYIKDANQVTVPIIDIEVCVDHPIFHMKLEDDITSSTLEGSKYGLPEGPVISQDKDMVESWMVDDFEAFVERIEDLCEDTYNLILTYKSRSKDHSFYYNYLAKDQEGNVIARFRLRLRISNHNVHSSKQQKSNKKDELRSEKLHELLEEKQILKLRNYPIYLTVNSDNYRSYDRAFEAFEVLLIRAIEVMHK